MLETWLNRGVEPTKWLLVGGITYTLAMTILAFFDAPVSTGALPNQTQNRTETAKRPRANVNWILTKNLFGEAGAQPLAAQTTETAVQTRLPLELRMVTLSDNPENSSAIVAQRGKPGLLYNVGESLPGNAELTEVHHDRIILRRAGVRETLQFPKTTNQFVATEFDDDNDLDIADDPENYSDEELDSALDSADSTDADQSQDPDDVVAQYKERLAEDAAGTLDELGIETVDTGGYRIGNSTQSSYLRQTGLQPGDVILSVNGRAVGDIQQDQLELENILAQGSARIEVQRGSRRFFITASLK